MKWAFGITIALFAVSNAAAQAPSPPERGFFNRVLHPFASANTKAPKYQDPRLRGLLLQVQVPTAPIRLSDVRQLRVRAILKNMGSSPDSVNLPTSQRRSLHFITRAAVRLT